MSYMLLIVEPVGQRETRTESQGRAAYEEMREFGLRLQREGKMRAFEALASEASATRVQVRGGKRKLIDGPYTEAKEMIGGFFLLDCESREEAVAIAAECPAAAWATVEVREIAPCHES